MDVIPQELIKIIPSKLVDLFMIISQQNMKWVQLNYGKTHN